MGEHVSVEGFFGGVLIAAIVTGLIAYWIAYSMWGKERDATKVKLQEADATLASMVITAAQERAELQRELAAVRTAAAQEREQERANHERELSTARERYERAREDSRKARDAYRTSEMRFVVAQLVGDIQVFICVLREADPPAGKVGDVTMRLQGHFVSARNRVNGYDPSLGELLANTRQDLQSVLDLAARGSSARTVDEDPYVAIALQSIALQALVQLDRWIKQNQPGDVD